MSKEIMFDPHGTIHREFHYERFETLICEGCAGASVGLYQRQILRKIPSLKDGSTLLELGSHSLELTRRSIGTDTFARAGCLVACDIQFPHHGAISLGSKMSPVVRFLQSDASQLGLSSASVDVVYHGCLLHHLENPLDMINEVRRVLKPGGTAVYYLPCDPGLAIRCAQFAVTKRRAKRFYRREGLSVDFVWAIEHRNHYPSLREMITYVHQYDLIQRHGFPAKVPFWNFRLFDIFVVTKSNA